MPKFALKYPYFIIMVCLIIIVVGVASILSMPVDMFPEVDIPVVMVATFYSGMPPNQIEGDITNTFERFFTLASNVDHIESRSMTGVSLIKIYFKPGTNANSALSTISNLAMADLRRLPPGTLPPVVLSMSAASQPICLITLKGKGLNETNLKDIAQFEVRDQVAAVHGASVPEAFGGRYREIKVYVDPLKLEAHNLSLMDVVHGINNSNLILPAGDVQIGAKDYNIYANSQVPTPQAINDLPLKSVGNASVLVGDVAHAEDSGARQTNIVRIDGQRSVYVPVLKQGGDSNTISIVSGVKKVVSHLVNVPASLKTTVVFDQSLFVKAALRNLGNEGGIGLVLTALMILIFLGSVRATFAVLLSIPLSAMAAFICLSAGGESINTMVLAGLALAFSRLIDNSVVVLENIFRHMEMGEPPEVAAEKGGKEVQLAVLAATFTTAIVFFPVVLLYGVSKYLFTALALSVVLSLFASYMVAMTVVPLYCAKFIRLHEADDELVSEDHPYGHEPAEIHRKRSWFQNIVGRFNDGFERILGWYVFTVNRSLLRPLASAFTILGLVLLSFLLLPMMGRAYFPRTDPGQFIMNIQCPNGSRIGKSNQYIAQVEQEIRQVIPPSDLGMIVSNIGITHGLAAVYSSNSSMDTAFVQVSLKEHHKVGSYEYMNRVRRKLAKDMPELTTFFHTGGLVDSVINRGRPAPIDIQISGKNMKQTFALANLIANKVRGLSDVSDVRIPQNLSYPGLELNIDRERASLIGLTPKQVVDNVITALTSNNQIAPDYWIDPKNGNNYMLNVQYSDQKITNMTMEDFENIPLRAVDSKQYTPLESVASIAPINTPTEVDHYELQRVIDVYVMPRSEALQGVSGEVRAILAGVHHSKDIRIAVRGSVVSMNQSFMRFGIGLILGVILVYLILMAQFASFVDPFIILMAVPPGLAGVILILLATHSTLNIMSLMGVIMMTGIVVSNSILIVEFAGHLRKDGMTYKEAIVESCRIRLRPILMTSFATLLGMIPMAMGLETGSEQYAPLARAIIGGLAVSVVATMYLVPAVYLLIYDRRGKTANVLEETH